MDKQYLWFNLALVGYIIIFIQSDLNWYQPIRIFGGILSAVGFIFFGRYSIIKEKAETQTEQSSKSNTH